MANFRQVSFMSGFGSLWPGSELMSVDVVADELFLEAPESLITGDFSLGGC
jgi:hypothetical protein